ncbi:sulfate adenylyltransferase subunit CysN [Buchnera aphidicola]|uniref:sulfate adenylyltransferase subunit CysN n=1 Tax=Buchnera aphidicola TaxID=9 RepID=UPI00346451F4
MNKKNNIFVGNNLHYKLNFKDWISLDKKKSLLRFLTCGSVDDGKSTLIGRLLYDTKHIYEDHLLSLHGDSKRHGTQGNKLDYALLVDGLQAEKEQGITIDVAYRYFSTNKRKFIIADTPGHEQYTRNMVTGASNCDLAILLIDVRKGLLEQTCRHAFIAVLLGINYLVIAINKMDLVDYKKDFFDKIKKDFICFSNKLNKELKIFFVPIVATIGENIVSSKNLMEWYQGSTLLHILETVKVNNILKKSNVRFPIQYVNRPNLDFRGYSGTLVSGNLRVFDKVKVLPSGMVSTIEKIVTFNGNQDQVEERQAITVVLKDNLDISRGDMLVDLNSNLIGLQRAIIYIVWMSETDLFLNKLYNVKLGNQNTRVYIKNILYEINVNTLKKNKKNNLCLNSVAVVEIKFEKPILFDLYCENKITGSMIFIDPISNITIAAGMIQKKLDQKDKKQDVNMNNFELELRLLISRYFPHWGVKKVFNN